MNTSTLEPDEMISQVLSRIAHRECRGDLVLRLLSKQATFDNPGSRAEWSARPRGLGATGHAEWSARPRGLGATGTVRWQRLQTNLENITSRIPGHLQQLLAQLRQRFLAGPDGLPALFQWDGGHRVSSLGCTGYAGLPTESLVVDYCHPSWTSDGHHSWRTRGTAIINHALVKMSPKPKLHANQYPDRLLAGKRLYRNLASPWGAEKDTTCCLFGTQVICVPQLDPTVGYLFPEANVILKCMTRGLIGAFREDTRLFMNIHFAFVFTQPDTFVQLLPLSARQ